MVLYQAETLLDRLIDIRDFAMEYVEEDALLHYANVLPLPSPDEQEEKDLVESPEGNPVPDSDENEEFEACEDQLAQQENAHLELSENIAAVDQQDSGAFTGTTDVDMEDTEPMWDGAIHGYDWPNVEEPSEYHSASSDEEDEMTDNAKFDPFEASPSTTTPESNTWLTNSPDAPHSVFFNTFVTFPIACAGDGQGVLSPGVEYSDPPQGPASAWLTNSPDAPEGVAEAETSSETWPGDGIGSLPVDHHLSISQDSLDNEEDVGSLSDSDSSDEITSQAIDDQIEKLRLAPSTLLHPHGWYWPTHFLDEIATQVEEYEEYVQKKNFLIKSISKNKTLSRDETDNILCEFVHENIVRKPVVNAVQLFKLKRFIDNVVRFVLATQRNIDAIDADMDEGRRRHFLPLDSPLRFRSKRLGSSLRFVTSVNDAWERGQDNWGMPPVKIKREQI
ncbi:hypothetical protein EDB82DRAFT_471183 [Fusarium venenatum]|nr:hypothetical protein EDB82DRAFT_471183 [Fusarium venenatum]